MLQPQVMNSRRRAPRLPSDTRAAALAVAAMAAAAFSLRPPQSVPLLEAGFGRPGPAADPSPRAAFAPAPVAAVAVQDRSDGHDAPPERTETTSAPGHIEAAGPATARLLSGLDGLGAARRDATPDGREAARPQSIRMSPSGRGKSPERGSVPAAFLGPGSSPARASAARRSSSLSEDASARGLVPSHSNGSEGPRNAHPPARRGTGTSSGDAVGARPGANSGHRRAAGSRPRENREEKPIKAKESRRSRHPAERRAAERREPHERNPARFRPLLLSTLIGPRALRPPPAGLEPPSRPADWEASLPARDKGGRAIPAAPAGLDALDDANPAALSRDRRPEAHWDGDEWHDGDVRGLVRGGTWLRLQRDGARWWAFAGDQGPAQLRHDGVWWMKERGIWFVVHEGRPWAWRSFQDWDAQGLFQPGSGTEMVYSKDFARVAVITPGEGATVFDAATGEELARIPEARMPARRRPKAPGELLLPSDVFAK